MAEQMGTSVKMIELHYGHINPALKAEEIAGKRHAPRVAAVTAKPEKEKNLAKPVKATKASKHVLRKSSVT